MCEGVAISGLFTQSPRGHLVLYVAEYYVLWKFNEDASDRDARWRK